MSILLTIVSFYLTVYIRALFKQADEKTINTVNPSGWRGSEDFWLDAAYEMLVESGVESVKVMSLAKRLKVSRTSFYWHFANRDELLAALIKRWQEKNTGNLIAQTKLYAETITEAVLNLFDCWLDTYLFDAQMDFAIRNWAQQSTELKAILEQTDADRMEAIRSLFERFGFSDMQADIRARTVYYTQIGYISMMVREPVSVRLQRMPTYVENFTGQYPSESEIARFMHRSKAHA